MSRIWSGVVRTSSEVMIELMHDDLPEPVVPAISRWGMVARLTHHGTPVDVTADGDFERVFGPACLR